MQGRGNLALTEASIAWAMDNEEGPKWPPMRRLRPNSTAAAPNGQSGFNAAYQAMNISQLAKTIGVSTDTVRYYEKQGLLQAPNRQDNGYRSYTLAHVEVVRFVRGAQSLGFSLAEIRRILPQFASGQLGRSDIERQLQTKMAQIDAHIQQLHTLKQELQVAFASLKCARDQPVSITQGTPAVSDSGAGAARARRSFAKPAAIALRPKIGSGAPL